MSAWTPHRRTDDGFAAIRAALCGPDDAAYNAEVNEAAQQSLTTIEAGEAEVAIETASVGGDSGLDSDGAESAASTSLSSSVRDYVFENGRRFHKFREGQYLFPNDDLEQDREDMKHALVVTVMGDKLHFAPIGETPQHILDMGTGTGIWCIEMAETYPSAQVQGIDLSPIQPVWVPPNVKFLVDDLESPWIEPSDHYDLVHGRHVLQAFKDYPTVLQRAFQHIKPGGFIELHEFEFHAGCDDGTLPPDGYALEQMLSYVAQGLKNLGPDLYGVLKLPGMLKDAGFVNVEDRIFKVPLGPWAKNKQLKKAGLYLQAMGLDGLQAIAMGPMTRGLGWRPEEVEVFLKGVREHLKDPSIHAYYNFHAIYAQKPF
ncbi:methyltransferase [Saccharata proteae CBS 121410]|uniref:Methyltransferase n=1 Tax=Saccharata proteae CBS 121410 TaxID=1314787 RepID=A0A9P4LWU4_9PEZI|nr:methyltransferase [Saccharata proteae CBS 121410]